MPHFDLTGRGSSAGWAGTRSSGPGPGCPDPRVHLDINRLELPHNPCPVHYLQQVAAGRSLPGRRASLSSQELCCTSVLGGLRRGSVCQGPTQPATSPRLPLGPAQLSVHPQRACDESSLEPGGGGIPSTSLEPLSLELWTITRPFGNEPLTFLAHTSDCTSIPSNGRPNHTSRFDPLVRKLRSGHLVRI